MISYFEKTKIKKRIVFGLVLCTVFLGTICADRKAVYAQDRLKWVFRDVGEWIPVTIFVTESNGKYYREYFVIDVLKANTTGSEYLMPATVNEPYEYQPKRGSNDVKVEIVEGPSWLKIDSSNWQMTGTPDEKDVGLKIPVTILITDRYKLTRHVKRVIDVISSREFRTYLPPAQAQSHYQYQFTKRNPDDTIEIVEGPPWLKIDSDTGILSGYPAERYDFSLPVISEDGTIYITGQDHFSRDKALFAISPEGKELWRYSMEGDVGLFSSIGSDGTLFLTCNGILYAFEPDSRSLKWTYQTDDTFGSSLSINSDGSIYVTSLKGFLYALTSDGTFMWKCLIGKDAESAYRNIRSHHAVGQDGTIYVGATDNYLYAVNPWGTIKWKFEVDNFFVTGSPSIGSDGTIYAAPTGRRLYAINPDGTEKWNNSETDNPRNSSPVIAADGTIYIGIYNSLYGFNADGTIKWQYPMGPYVNSTPIIGTGGIVYHVGPEIRGIAYLFAFNPDGTLNWKYEMTEMFGHSLAMSSDGTLYMSSREGLCAFQTDSNGYQEDAQWPALMHNNTRSVAADDILLPDLYNMSGQISLSDTLMNEGVLMTVNGLATETLKDGSYSMSLPNGEYELLIHADTQELPKSLDFVINQRDKVIRLWRKKYAISGIVTEEGEPLVGISVSVGDRRVFTDENGMYFFELSNGTYTIKLDLDENSFPNSREFTVDGTDMVLAEFEINRFIWEYEIGEKTKHLPAFDTDKSILLFPNESGIHHLNADGTFIGNYPQLGGLQINPSQGKDGTFYVPGWSNLVAWTPTGGIKWSLEVDEKGFGAPPAIGLDGTLYFGSNENVYAVNHLDGSVLWTFPCGDVSPSPSIASDGTIYVSSTDDHVYALNPDGTVKWQYSSTADFNTTPVIGNDGTIYVGGYDMFFHALNPDGTLKWKFETMSATSEDPVIDADGTIYFTNQDDYLYALNSDGTLKWKYFSEEGWSGCSVVITQQNTILAASRDGVLRLLDLNGSLIWQHRFEDCRLLYPALGDDGTMYLLMNENYGRIGYIRAFLTGTGGYQKNSPWPCYMGNNQRTGNISDMITAVEQEYADLSAEDLPVAYALGENYPNPFNSSTTISYSLPEAGHTIISVLSVSGQKVATLLDEYKEAGTHSVQFDGNNLASGVYFYRMESPGYSGALRMLLIK
jgi:outer membrane protein assembly factor BamB